MKLLPLLVLLVTSKVVDAQGEPVVPSDTSVVIGARTLLPEFPGGHAAFLQYLAANLQWPDTSGPGGKVFMTFTVEEDGSLTGPEVLRGKNVMADSEAMRLVRAMPRWNPGRDLEGKPMRQRMNLPIQIRTR